MADTPECLYCKQTSNDLPLVEILYRGVKYWICPQHIPLMIHEPGKLIGKIPDLDQYAAYDEGGSAN